MSLDLAHSEPGLVPIEGHGRVGAALCAGADGELRDLLTAFSSSRAKNSKVTVSMTSKGGMCREGARVAREAGLTGVQFREEPSDPTQLLSECDLFVALCYSDAVPVALLEAMAAGLPVITTDSPRLRRIVEDGITGFLIPVGDTACLVSRLVTLLKDAELRAAMGKSAQAYAKRMHGGSLFAGRAAYGYDVYPPPGAARQRVKAAVYSLIPRGWLLWHGRRDRPQYALTFDDGPDLAFTPRILDTLRELGVRATFFLIGNRAEEHPDLVRRMVDEGHEIANHSYTHPQLKRCSQGHALDEVRRTESILDSLEGRKHRLFRPPFGYVNRQCVAAAWAQRNRIIMWSLDPKDYCAREPGQILAKLEDQPVQNGDIILYHGTNPAALAALPDVIKAAGKDCRRPATISELAY